MGDLSVLCYCHQGRNRPLPSLPAATAIAVALRGGSSTLMNTDILSMQHRLCEQGPFLSIQHESLVRPTPSLFMLRNNTISSQSVPSCTAVCPAYLRCHIAQNQFCDPPCCCLIHTTLGKIFSQGDAPLDPWPTDRAILSATASANRPRAVP